MAEKSLVMTFLNREGSKTSITLAGIKDNVTEAEVSAAMDIVIAKGIFYSNGGDLVAKQSAQITEKNVAALDVK
jgi:hypothetical protein